MLWRFNDTAASCPAEVCVHELVGAQAARTPAAVALEWEGATLTYASLQGSAGAVGVWLRAHGVASDRVVALQLHRSLEQVVGMVGVLRSGGAYLPLDSVWAAERRGFMFTDAGIRQLISVTLLSLLNWFSGIPSLKTLQASPTLFWQLV